MRAAGRDMDPSGTGRACGLGAYQESGRPAPEEGDTAMSRGTFWKAAALGAALATPAAAGTTPFAAQGSPLALPMVENSADAGPMIAGAPGTDPSYVQASSWESIRYRPRRHDRDPDEYDRGYHS